MPFTRPKPVASVLAGLFLVLSGFAAAEEYPVDAGTGLVIDTGWEKVRTHCIACHSSRLVTQNRMTRADWSDTIAWMQDEQGLWDLGDDEAGILIYLEKHYGIPESAARKPPLTQ